MRTRRRATITDLRRAIDGLPRDTRVAMLQGIRSNDIIVGAYTGSERDLPDARRPPPRSAKTSHIAFAKAWDLFALGGARDRAARRATRRELLVLNAHLEASLLEEDPCPAWPRRSPSTGVCASAAATWVASSPGSSASRHVSRRRRSPTMTTWR